MIIDVPLENNDGSLAALGEMACAILAAVRKEKSTAQVSPKYPVETLYLTFNEITAVDILMGSSFAYDIMAATNAKRMILRMLNPGINQTEEAKEWQ